jgi:cytoskeletal protein CcmA (bactofilin family)
MSGEAVKTTLTTSSVHPARVMGIATALAALLVVVLASAAFAQESQLGGKLRAGEEVIVPADEIVATDLYASGGLVRIEGTVDGDLFATAAQVEITGSVTGDVMATGGAISIDGDVQGDVRVAGGRVAVTGPVGEDLLVAGGQVRVASSAVVGEDLLFGTGEMALDGAVTGDVLGATGSYVNRGSIGGTENVTIQERQARTPTVADRVLDVVARLASVLIIAALVLWLFPRLVEGPARTLRERPLMSGLLGLGGVVAVILGIPLLIVVAALLVIALAFVGLTDLVGLVVLTVVATLVVAALLLILAVSFGAPAIVGMTLGRFLIPASAAGRRWWALCVGVVLVVIVSALPVIGGWFAFVAALFGFGALLLNLAPWERTPPVDAPAAQEA